MESGAAAVTDVSAWTVGAKLAMLAVTADTLTATLLVVVAVGWFAPHAAVARATDTLGLRTAETVGAGVSAASVAVIAGALAPVPSDRLGGPAVFKLAVAGAEIAICTPLAAETAGAKAAMAIVRLVPAK